MDRTRRHRLSDAHLVDEYGLVGCPRRGHDVPVETCLDCEGLQEVVRADGRVSEIRCDRPRPLHLELLPPFLTVPAQRSRTDPDR